MTAVRERYRPQPMAANTSYEIKGGQVGGFLAKTAGTLTITDADGTILVNAQPVAAGAYVPLPFLFSTGAGGTVALAGGASGTLAI